MSEFHLRATDESPEVTFDPENGQLKLAGISRPPNAVIFYQNIGKAVKSYRDQLTAITFDYRLAYCNSQSTKCILMLITDLETLALPITVHWHYDEEDEEMLDFGKELEEITKIKFEYFPFT